MKQPLKGGVAGNGSKQALHEAAVKPAAIVRPAATVPRLDACTLMFTETQSAFVLGTAGTAATLRHA